MNKGIIVAFSFLVGCGAATAAYLLYTSKRDSSDNKDSNENNDSNEIKKAIKTIEQIFAGHKKNDDNNGMKKNLIDVLNEGHKSPEEAIEAANKYFEKDEDQADEDKAKGRSYSSDSDFSLASNETIDGGKKTKRVIKRSKKSRSKKSKSKSKSKIYKKLI